MRRTTRVALIGVAAIAFAVTLFAVRDEHWQELFAEMDKKAS